MFFAAPGYVFCKSNNVPPISNEREYCKTALKSANYLHFRNMQRETCKLPIFCAVVNHNDINAY